MPGLQWALKAGGLLLGLGLLGRCSPPEHLLIVVNVQNVPPGVQALHVESQFNGKGRMSWEVTTNLNQFSIHLPNREDQRGSVRLDVAALASDQCAVTSGNATVEITADALLFQTDVTLAQPSGAAQCLGAASHYDGTAWYPLMLEGRQLQAVAGSSPSNVWAVGLAGTILHYDGSAWTATVPSPTSETLFGVWTDGPNNAWAVGGNGVIVHYDGISWRPMSSSTNQTLYAITGANQALWAVGLGGTTLGYANGAWMSNGAGSGGNDLFALWQSGPSDVWAAGRGGKLRHYTANQWTDVSPTGTTQTLRGLWGSGPSDIWAVGDQGATIHYDGTRWSPIPSGISEPLTCVWGSGAKDIWAASFGGTILHNTSSGWYSTTADPSVHLSGLWGAAASDIWTVGTLGDTPMTLP